MHHSNLRNLVLLDPIQQGADKLKIVVGYATHTMASWHIKQIAEQKFAPIDITLLVGMCRFDGISEAVHDGFKSIVSRNNTLRQSNLTCQYVVEGASTHSKLYVWEKSGTPFCAYMGSANYTQSAFSRSRRELIHECDPNEAAQYFDSIERDSMYCDHAEIEEKVTILPTHSILDLEETPLASVKGAGVESIRLSLLTSENDVGFGSGINWGHRRSATRREPNQMYIPLPASIKRNHPDFFPITADCSGKGNPNFSVLTDDGKNFIFRVQQEGNKGITTPLGNALIGEYFRSRLGLANGAFVTKQNLENYGRVDVTFYKIDDEQYFMDFSI